MVINLKEKSTHTRPWKSKHCPGRENYRIEYWRPATSSFLIHTCPLYLKIFLNSTEEKTLSLFRSYNISDDLNLGNLE